MNITIRRPRVNSARHTLTLALLLATLAITAGLLTACGGTGGHSGSQQAARRYHCPMHPTIVSDHPGKCPICGMDLVPIDESTAGDSSHASMSSGDGGDMDATHATIHVEPQAARMAGVRTETARRGTLSRPVRAVGLVTADERQVRRAQTKVGGWVEKLNVNVTGQAVNAGQPLLSIYSPELLAAQQEFLSARQSLAALPAEAGPGVRDNLAALVEAARRRLTLAGVPDAVVAKLESEGAASRAVTLDAPASGYVTAREVYEGMQVEPGMTLMTVTDLRQVWIEARLFESEASFARVGAATTVTLPFDPSFSRPATVRFVVPYVDDATRTLTVRLELDNADLALKPGMYADVTFESAGEDGILVSDSAVLETGTRQIVFVRRADDHYEPREVTVGLRAGGRALIRSGLDEGEEVVVGAAFLIDSESRLKAALAAMSPGGAGGGHEHGGGGQ